LVRFLGIVLLCAATLTASETEQSVHQSVPISSATHLRLNADFGNVSIKPSDGRTVDVEARFRGDPPSRREFDRMLHDFSLKITQQGSEVSLDAIFIHGWEPALSFLLDGGFFGHHSMCRDWQCLIYSTWLDEVELRVTVPRQFGTSLTTSSGSIGVTGMKGEVTARTSGGWLSFDRVEGAINASTSGGGIALSGVTGKSAVHTSGGWIRVSDMSGDLDASTSGGWISIDTASGRIKVHTSGGWITARAISGTIDASTSGGGVTAALVAQPRAECRLYTSGGWINLSLPSNAHVDLDASTSGGGVTTDFPVAFADERNHSTLRAPLNGGGPLVYLHTSGGWIHVKRSGGI
jgi:hypothetical protein